MGTGALIFATIILVVQLVHGVVEHNKEKQQKLIPIKVK